MKKQKNSRFAYYATSYKGLKEALVNKDITRHKERSEQLCKHTFVFDSPWDMEPCYTPITLTNIDWNAIQNNDEEWTFMLNRMEYLQHLVIMWLVEEDERYLNKWIYFVTTWIQDHQVVCVEPSMRTLDTAIRCVHFLEGVVLLYDHLCEDVIDMIQNSVKVQFAFLKAQYVSKYTLSNWGFIQTSAILYGCYLLYDDPKATPLYQWAKAEFLIQCDLQIYEEGVCWEQSTMYHVEILLYLCLVYQKEPSLPLKTLIRNMSNAVKHLTTPMGYIEAYGDSDRTYTDDVLASVSHVLQEYLWVHTKQMDGHMLCHFGCPRKTGKVKNITETMFFAKANGIMTWRSNWSKKASFLQFVNGGLGSGHGHSDNLHVSLYHHGYPFLIDCGRYTYREDDPLRILLKSQKAHNNIVIDDTCASIPNGSWTYETYVKPLAMDVHTCEVGIYTSGSIWKEGGNAPYLQLRTCVALHAGIYIFFDEVHCQGKHHVDSYFHLDPNVALKQERNCILLSQDKAHLMYQASLPSSMDVLEEPCSFTYNVLDRHSVLKNSLDFHDVLRLGHVFVDTSIQVSACDIYQEGVGIVSQDVLSAWRFDVFEDEWYVVMIAHKELYKGKKILYYQDIPMHGQCYILHHKNGYVTTHRMKG